jgi:hypothetical protein
MSFVCAVWPDADAIVGTDFFKKMDAKLALKNGNYV